jgi:hypothetical protein
MENSIFFNGMKVIFKFEKDHLSGVTHSPSSPGRSAGGKYAEETSFLH